MAKILLTSPDFPPRIGGLSTFTVNIKYVLESMGHNVDLHIWKSIFEGRKIRTQPYDYIINIQAMFSGFIRHPKQINFFHGSEILFYSPNFFKRLVKKLTRGQYLKFFQSAYKNIFISEYTLKVLEKQGLRLNYARDLVFHNCIDLSQNKFIKKDLEGDIEFVCIARDVPHKNLKGAIKFTEDFATATKKRVIIHLSSKRFLDSNKVIIKNHPQITDEMREDLYKRCHFNLLMSLNHQRFGFFEGFGLTVLEAGKWGTPSIVSGEGGLAESVHHETTGWDLSNQISLEKILDKYEYVSNYCYKHTLRSHGLNLYEKLFKGLLQ